MSLVRVFCLLPVARLALVALHFTVKQSRVLLAVLAFAGALFGQVFNQLHRAVSAEVVVSHSDENGVLQLFRVNEDGTNRRQLTHSRHDCLMPACSADGERLAYVKKNPRGISLIVCDLDGENTKTLVGEGINLIPSWTPDSRKIVWMKGRPGKSPFQSAQIHVVDVETGRASLLFTDTEQAKFSNMMPVVSPQGGRIAFVSNRSEVMRIWVSDLDGSNATPVSKPETEFHKGIGAPIEQKVPAWSPDGKWIAHWEGVEMTYLSKFTGVADADRDKLISSTWNVWVVRSDGTQKRKVGRGDDPTWSPEGYVTRAFPDPKRGGPKVIMETERGEKELPIVPPRRNWGRFTWLPKVDG